MEKSDKIFREKYEKLQEKYSNEFVAAENGEILDHDKNLKDLISRLGSQKKDLTLVLIRFIPEKGLEILF